MDTKPDWTPPMRSRGPLTESDVREIRRALAMPFYVDAEEIMAHYGISRSMVSQIKLRRVWAHVDPPLVERSSVAAELRLGSFDQRRGQKARTVAAQRAWELIST